MSELIILRSLTVIIGTTFFGLPTPTKLLQVYNLGYTIHTYLSSKKHVYFSGHQKSCPSQT